uniref:Secreted protein n=1 Tax=Anguilla anguilla TaxID=7936 RepID=A0A0E9WSM7_ANGAN
MAALSSVCCMIVSCALFNFLVPVSSVDLCFCTFQQQESYGICQRRVTLGRDIKGTVCLVNLLSSLRVVSLILSLSGSL